MICNHGIASVRIRSHSPLYGVTCRRQSYSIACSAVRVVNYNPHPTAQPYRIQLQPAPPLLYRTEFNDHTLLTSLPYRIQLQHAPHYSTLQSSKHQRGLRSMHNGNRHREHSRHPRHHHHRYGIALGREGRRMGKGWLISYGLVTSLYEYA